MPDRRSLARHVEGSLGSTVRSGHRGLPSPVTPLIGRTDERKALVAALTEHRLVTATGPGGIGKTRLALSVASELAAGRHAARDNPIALTIIERAAAIAADDRRVLVDLAATFSRLNCPYQERRTRALARLGSG